MSPSIFGQRVLTARAFVPRNHFTILQLKSSRRLSLTLPHMSEANAGKDVVEMRKPPILHEQRCFLPLHYTAIFELQSDIVSDSLQII